MLHSNACPPNTAPWLLPTQDDIAAAVQQMKNVRAADSEQLFAELPKAAGNIESQRYTGSCRWCLPTACQLLPRRPWWYHCTRKTTSLCSDCRGIPLISKIRKVISLLIAKPLTPWAEGQQQHSKRRPPRRLAQAAQIAAADPPLLECQSNFRPCMVMLTSCST